MKRRFRKMKRRFNLLKRRFNLTSLKHLKLNRLWKRKKATFSALQS